MDQPIVVKWTLNGTYRARLLLDDIFDPTTEYTPVYSEIFTKLLQHMPYELRASQEADTVALEVRLSGSKEYVPLRKDHRTAVLESRRMRLRVVALQRPITPVKDSVQNIRVDPLVEFSLQRPITPVKESVQNIRVDPLVEFLLASSAARPPTGIEAASSHKSEKIEPSTEKAGKEPIKHEEISVVPEYITRAEVQAMIEQRVAELEIAVQAKNEVKPQTQQKLKIKPKKDETQHQSYKHSAICDFCDQIICGQRWKCLDCPDFDTCQDCHAQISTAHATHRFVRLNDDCISRPAKVEARAFHAGVFCDGPACKDNKRPISGDRYKCSMCLDFDLCAGCEVHPQNKHNKTHPMIKLKQAIADLSVDVKHADPKVKPHGFPIFSGLTRASPPSYNTAETWAKDNFKHVKHITVCCDACDRMVHGDRYMCATCSDFDLCEKCYTSTSHPSDHVFVRYREFINHTIAPRMHIPAVKPVRQLPGKKGPFFCNICQQSPVSGKRFNCLVCHDWDACENCIEQHQGKAHAMQIVPEFQASTQRLQDTPCPGTKESSQSTKSSSDVPRTSAMRLQAGPNPLPKVTTPEIIKDFISSLALPRKTASAVAEELKSVWVEDVSIPDGTTITAGTSFVKQWLVKNNGSVAWPAGVSALFTGGVDLSPSARHEAAAPTTTVLQSPTLPGQSVVISVFLQAPEKSKNNSLSYFRLATEDNKRFGAQLWVDIDVTDAKVPSGPVEIESQKVEDAAQEVEVEVRATALAIDAEASAQDVIDSAAASGMTESVSESVMIFPSASTELAKSAGSPESKSVSAPGSQHDAAWGSEDDISLSEDSEYDLLDNESFSDA